MNNLMLQLTKTAAKRSPDTGAAHTSMHEGAAMDNGQMPAGDLAQEVWRREEELKRREAEIIRRELHAKAVEALTALEMPVELAQLLDYTDEEHYAASLETLKSVWQSALKKAVEARLAGSAPKAGDGKAVHTNTMRAAISAHYNR